MNKNPSERIKDEIRRTKIVVNRHVLAQKIRQKIFNSGINITDRQVEAVLKELENEKNK